MVLRFSLFAGVLLFMSCSVPERDNPEDQRSKKYRSSSSVAKSSGSVALFSSSSKQSSSSQSSSSAVVSSSSSMPSSSSSPYRLVCEVTEYTGIADEPIYDMPEVICIENKSKDEFILEPEYDFQWINAPNWNAPKAGTYSKIQVKVNSDAVVCQGLTATCSGTLTISKPSSSSSVPPSSSSVAKSSSSAAVSSSSSKPSSSSSVPPSSSSVAKSSSSAAVSSSSSKPSSSSSVLLSSSSSACTASNNTSTRYCSNGTMKDYGFVTYEGQTYKTVVIGTQTWMAENLNYDVPDNNTDVCYNNNSANCTMYGRLYDWALAKSVCPSGWHLPSNAEWDVLINNVGGSAGKYLKVTDGWNGENKFGFAALPGGYGGLSDSSFYYVGYSGHWWSASGNIANFADAQYMYYDLDGVYKNSPNKYNLLSVRCLKN
ncbi:MAG: fibrobacter succinogenes major paralogous domain-containing protein [Fibromonadales bacterium]|nr:fibrobacter succinogenes major paralogous domain-containing protein [Fibromonadales bacterium]